jgi:hypothetical protein
LLKSKVKSSCAAERSHRRLASGRTSPRFSHPTARIPADAPSPGSLDSPSLDRRRQALRPVHPSELIVMTAGSAFRKKDPDSRH